MPTEDQSLNNLASIMIKAVKKRSRNYLANREGSAGERTLGGSLEGGFGAAHMKNYD